MSISKYNSEGYLDLTAYEALLAIERKTKMRTNKPIIYICSPFKGDVKRNIEKARGYCRFAVAEGGIPIAVHLLFPQFMDDDIPDERAAAISMGVQLLVKCDELWAFGTRISEGMAIEMAAAKTLGLKVRRFNDRCLEVE